MYNSYSDTFYTPTISTAVKWIIILNIGLFLITFVIGNFNWFNIFGLVPAKVFHHLAFWQLGTYLFFHGGIWHLLINMLMLFYFGCALERKWGTKRFIKFYFLTGVGAGICSVLTSFNSTVPIVGASGAIFGVLVAYAVLFPETTVFMFFIFPMKIKYAVYIFGAINLFGALGYEGGNIAYIAHLGGGALGYIYVKSGKLRWKIKKLFTFMEKQKKESMRRKSTNLDKEVDRILEKISNQGIDKLTPEEKKILEKKKETLD